MNQFAPYSSDWFRGQVEDGRLDFQADYRVDASNEPLAVKILHLGLELKQLTVTAPGTEEVVLALPSPTIQEAGADLSQKTVAIDSLSLSDGTIVVRRRRDGSLNFLALLAEPEQMSGGSAPASSAETQVGWRLSVKAATLANFTVAGEDHMPATPARLTLDQLNATLKGFTFPEKTPVASALSFRWNRKGTLVADGTLRHTPLFADAQVEVKDIDLRPLQPYLGERLSLQLTYGVLHARGRLLYGAPDRGAPLLRYAGTAAIDQVIAADARSSEAIAKWDQVALNGIQADVSPTQVKVDELRVNQLRQRIVIEPHGRVNVATLMREWADSSRPVEGKARFTESDKAQYALKSVVVDHAVIQFVDRSVNPPVMTGIQELKAGYVASPFPKGRRLRWTCVEGPITVRRFRLPGCFNPAKTCSSISRWRSKVTTFRSFRPTLANTWAIPSKRESSRWTSNIKSPTTNSKGTMWSSWIS